MSFTIAQDGAWYALPMRDYRIACCDCGLVHRTQFRIINGRLQFRVWRDRSATRQRRRQMRTRKQP